MHFFSELKTKHLESFKKDVYIDAHEYNGIKSKATGKQQNDIQRDQVKNQINNSFIISDEHSYSI